MALINCPECGRADISSEATQCPKCGYNIKEHFELIKKQKQKQLAQEKENAEILKKIFELNVKRNAEIEEIKKAQKPEQPKFLKSLFEGEIKVVTIIIFIVSIIFFIASISSFKDDNPFIGILLMLISLGLSIWYITFNYKSYKEDAKEYNSIVKDYDAYKENQIKQINKKYDELIHNLNTYGTEYNPHEMRHYPQPQQIKPKCPTCGSTNISKISTLNRGASVYAVGLASKKIGKQFKCEKCGYLW